MINKNILFILFGLFILLGCGNGSNPSTYKDINVNNEEDNVSTLNRKVANVEDFGDIGADINDNAIFKAAINSGKTIYASGPEYNLDNLEINQSVSIIFSPSTVIKNIQTSGEKKAAITVSGSTGSSTEILTIVPAGGLEDTVTVEDASLFSIGDTVRIFENELKQDETKFGTATAGKQDFNYREFATIGAIDGNNISFHEYLRWDYNITKSMTLQKINFVENVYISGGIWKGSINSGDGIKLEFCRTSYVGDIKGYGNGDDDRLGGTPLVMSDCWECKTGDIYAKWTLFVAHFVRNQSCIFGSIKGKRTSNGGVMNSGNIFCNYESIVLDSAGDDNGDGIGISGGQRWCTFESIILSGSRCYGAWIHESSDNNSFLSFVSKQGITTAIYNFGDNNYFNMRISGHHGNGLYTEGSRVTAIVDIECNGYGVFLGKNTQGHDIQGRSISTGTASQSRDLYISSNVSYSNINLVGGVRGINYRREYWNHTNQISLASSTPFNLGKIMTGYGYIWSNIIINVKDIPQPLKVPGGIDSDGLENLPTTSSSTASVYRIKLKASTTIEDTHSEYEVMSRNGRHYLIIIYEGSHTFTPKLQINNNVVEVFSGVTNNGQHIKMSIEKY